MSPLAAASASGESCTGGALPRTFTSHFSGIPLTTASPRRGWFFQTQRFAYAAFLPGSCSYPATLGRCQDAAPARLSNKRQRESPGGAHSTFRAGASATSAGRDWGRLSRCLSGPKRAFGLQKLEIRAALGPKRKQEFPALTKSGGATWGNGGLEESVIHLNLSHFLGSNFLCLSAGQ